MPVKSVPTLGWTRRSAAISVLLVLEEQRKRAGERVVKLREARGWSQEDLAGKAGLSVKTVSRFENGRHEGRNETVRKLARALKVNEVDITGPPPAPLGLSEQPEPIEGDLAGILAKIEAQLAEQTRVLEDIKAEQAALRALIAGEEETRLALDVAAAEANRRLAEMNRHLQAEQARREAQEAADRAKRARAKKPAAH